MILRRKISKYQTFPSYDYCKIFEEREKYRWAWEFTESNFPLVRIFRNCSELLRHSTCPIYHSLPLIVYFSRSFLIMIDRLYMLNVICIVKCADDKGYRFSFSFNSTQQCNIVAQYFLFAQSIGFLIFTIIFIKRYKQILKRACYKFLMAEKQQI